MYNPPSSLRLMVRGRAELNQSKFPTPNQKKIKPSMVSSENAYDQLKKEAVITQYCIKRQREKKKKKKKKKKKHTQRFFSAQTKSSRQVLR